MKLPQMIRNLWIYRRLVGLAVVLGVVFFFVGANWSDVEVNFPFIGSLKSRVGVVMLISAALGAAATWLTMTFRRAIEDARREREQRPTEPSSRPQANVAAAEPGTPKKESEGPASSGP